MLSKSVKAKQSPPKGMKKKKDEMEEILSHNSKSSDWIVRGKLASQAAERFLNVTKSTSSPNPECLPEQSPMAWRMVGAGENGGPWGMELITNRINKPN